MLKIPPGLDDPFPDFLDSTAITNYKTCPTLFYWANVRRVVPAVSNVHLVAGGALAAGLEVARKAFFRGTSLEGAEAKGLKALLINYTIDGAIEGKENKAVERVAEAYECYLAQYPLDRDLEPVELPDGTLGVELRFTLELDPVHPVTRHPLLFSGRIDFIGDGAIGRCLVDEKTCSSIEKDTSHWDLRSQFHGYAVAADYMGVPAKWVIVRRVALQKTQIQLAPSIMISVDQWKKDRWREETEVTMRQAASDWQDRQWLQALCDVCGRYGGCTYKDLCRMPDPHRWEQASGFIKSTWNPLTPTHTLGAQHGATSEPDSPSGCDPSSHHSDVLPLARGDGLVPASESQGDPAV